MKYLLAFHIGLNNEMNPKNEHVGLIYIKTVVPITHYSSPNNVSQKHYHPHVCVTQSTELLRACTHVSYFAYKLFRSVGHDSFTTEHVNKGNQAI